MTRTNSTETMDRIAASDRIAKDLASKEVMMSNLIASQNYEDDFLSKEEICSRLRMASANVFIGWVHR